MLLKKQGVEVELAPCTPQGWPDEDYLVERLHDPRVRVLAVSFVDRKSTRLNSSHGYISYAVFCLKKKKKHKDTEQLHPFMRPRCQPSTHHSSAVNAALY